MKSKYLKKYSIIRIIGSIIAMILCLAALSSCSLRRTGKKDDNDTEKPDYVKPDIIYSVGADGTASVEGFVGELTDAVIQSEYDGYPVVSISRRAFYKCRTMTSVIIPDSVKSIGRYAFGECTSLSSVTLPANISAISGNAFKNVPWFDSLTDEYVIVGDGVLLDYNGTDTVVTVPEGIKYLSMAFSSVKDTATEIIMPSSLTTIGEYAFSGMKGLITINIPESVTDIGAFAFMGCNLTEITIPKSVTNLGSQAFSYCRSLKTVNIPSSITKYNDGLFNNCKELTSFTVSPSISSIGNDVFFFCEALNEIHIPSSVTEIGTNVFDGVPESFTIYAPAGSKAQSYAAEYGFNFKEE